VLRYDAAPPRATITIDDPERRNPLSNAAMAEMADMVERAGADDSIRVIVITGSGDHAFSAGGDLSGGFVDSPIDDGPRFVVVQIDAAEAPLYGVERPGDRAGEDVDALAAAIRAVVEGWLGERRRHVLQLEQPVQAQVAHVDAVEHYGAGRRVEEARYQGKQGRLARSRVPDQANGGARGDFEVHVVERGNASARIAEGQPAEFEPASHGLGALRPRLGRDRGGHVHQFGDTSPRRRPALEQVHHPAERLDRPVEHSQVDGERHELAECDAPVHHLAAAQVETDQRCRAGQ